MRSMVGDRLGLRLPGRSAPEDAETVLAAGADRIGASASVAIVTGAEPGAGGY